MAMTAEQRAYELELFNRTVKDRYLSALDFNTETGTIVCRRPFYGSSVLPEPFNKWVRIVTNEHGTLKVGE